MNNPIVTYASVLTKDGVAVQMLGLDLGRHFFNTLRALKIPLPAFFGALIKEVVQKVLPNRKAPSKVLKLMPAFQFINKTIADAAASMTFRELEAQFNKNGVWWCIVRSPEQALGYEQAEATGCIRKEGGVHYVNCPLQF